MRWSINTTVGQVLAWYGQRAYIRGFAAFRRHIWFAEANWPEDVAASAAEARAAVEQLKVSDDRYITEDLFNAIRNRSR